MAITKSKQDWAIGSTVRVGFLSLKVEAMRPTPGDSMPDVYVLSSAKGQRYEFTPHYGLQKMAVR